jgi:hypothetical protein
MSSSHLILFDIYTLIPKENNNFDLYEGVERIENIIITLVELKKKKTFDIGIISEHNIDSIYDHLSEDILYKCDYIFSEYGIKTYKNNMLIHKESITQYLGKEILMEIIFETNEMINHSWVSFINQQIIIKTRQIEIHFEISDTVDNSRGIYYYLESLLLGFKIRLTKHNVTCYIKDNIIIIYPNKWNSDYFLSIVDKYIDYDKITVFRETYDQQIDIDLLINFDDYLVKEGDDISDIIRRKFLQ